MKNVEDIFPLTPMQKVMLLHAQSSTRGDVLFNQFCYEIRGALNVDAWRASWQCVVDRHPALRSCFVWEDLKQPLQIVRQRVSIPFELLDWRDEPAEQREAAIAALKRNDRLQPFDPRRAPLLRFKLARLAPDRYFFLWSSHHLLLDRWCLGTLYRDLSAAYTAACRGVPVAFPRMHPYRDYLHWIGRRDPAQAGQFWRSQLSGFATPTPLTRRGGRVGGEGSNTPVERVLPAPLSQALRDLARTQGVTVSILVQAALALATSQVAGRADVVFGSVVSGRPVDLPGVESIVGTFVGNVPVRVTIPRGRGVLDWLKDLQTAQARRTPYEYLSPADIQAWSELRDRTPVFDTLLVWLAAGEEPRIDGLRVAGVPGETATAYPLTLSVLEGAQHLTLRLDLQPGHEMREPGFDLLETLQRLLGRLSELTPTTRIEELGARVSDLDAVPAAARPAHGYRDHRSGRAANRDISAAGREPLTVEVLTEMLRAEWGVLLGTEPASADDDFFASGGTSLLAARLHARVETNLHQSVPLMTLFREPTLGSMVEALRARDWPLKAETVIAVRPQGERPPLFCVSSPDVNTLGYAQLARHLPDHQPLYVLQSPPDSDRIRRLDPDELPQVARTYVEAMKTVQPAGPYSLLGMCTGAQLAFEMARQLVGSGQQVAFVGIVDTYAFYTVSRLFHVKRLFNRYLYCRARLADLVQRPVREQLALLAAVARRRIPVPRPAEVPAPQTALAAERGTAAPAVAAGQEGTVAAARGDPWIDGVGWVRNRGRIDTYPGLLTVYRRRRQKYWRIREFSLGWSYFAEQVRVEPLSARQHSYILREPHVRVFAARLGDDLQSAQTAHVVEHRHRDDRHRPGRGAPS